MSDSKATSATIERYPEGTADMAPGTARLAVYGTSERGHKFIIDIIEAPYSELRRIARDKHNVKPEVVSYKFDGTTEVQ